MAKDPAFLFYSSDFLTGTLLMPFEDRGKYITILSYMHQNGRLSEETIRLLVGSVSVMLRLKFSVDKNGLWYNERLELEVDKRKNFVSSRSENGKKGGRPPKKPTLLKEEINKPTHNLREDVNENEYVIEINTEKEKKIKEVSLQILEKFNFTETKNYDKLAKISAFVRVLFSTDRIEYFAEQYKSYWEYKKLSGSITQSLETFISDGWDREVWTEKLKELSNAKSKSTNSEDRKATVANAAKSADDYINRRMSEIG